METKMQHFDVPEEGRAAMAERLEKLAADARTGKVIGVLLTTLRVSELGPEETVEEGCVVIDVDGAYLGMMSALPPAAPQVSRVVSEAINTAAQVTVAASRRASMN